MVSDNILYVGTLQGKVLALDLATVVPGEGGEPLRPWEPKVVAKAKSSGGLDCMSCSAGMSQAMGIYSAPAVKSGRLYVAAYSGQVLWFSTDGRMKSDSPFETGGEIIGGLTISDDTVFVGSTDKRLYALTLDLEEKWQFKTKGEIWCTPVVSNGVVYVSSADHNVYAIDIESGNEIWHFETEAAVMSTPLVENGKVYVGGCDRNFYAIQAATPDERLAASQREEGSPPEATRDNPDSVFEGAKNWFWTRALARNGQIWVGNLDHNIYVLDANDVAEQLHDPYKTGGMVYSPPVELNGLIVAGSQDGKLYAIDPSTWDLTVYAIDTKANNAVLEQPDEPIKGLPPIFAPMFADEATGVLYFHAQNGTHVLYAFRLSTKEVLWTYQTDKIK